MIHFLPHITSAEAAVNLSVLPISHPDSQLDMGTKKGTVNQLVVHKKRRWMGMIGKN